MIKTNQEHPIPHIPPTSNLILYQKRNSLFICATVNALNAKQQNTHLFSLLIDSGATRNFVDAILLHKLQIPTVKLERSIRVILIDGQKTGSGHITHYTFLKLQFENEMEQEEMFYVTKLDHEHPLVLGFEWLERHNPIIDWKTPSLAFRGQNGKLCAIKVMHTTSINKEIQDITCISKPIIGNK